MHQLGVSTSARIAVAVSGGADSVALALMLKPEYDVTALTVDHGLRSESSIEANAVGLQMRNYGIAHHILTWEHESTVPSSNVQAQARVARYDLMAEWCASQGIKYLLTAHHRNDQAETLLLRLARGSGVYGLAAMDATRQLTSNVTLLRPLLEIGKEQLTAFLKNQNIAWIEDPSNDRDIFERVKARKLLDAEPLVGLTANRLAETAKRLRRTRNAIKFYEDQWLENAVVFHDAGYAELKQSMLSAAPIEIILRGLTSVLRFAGGNSYGPRFEKLERLFSELQSDNFNGCTLAGVKFGKVQGDSIIVTRELSLASEPQEIQDSLLWDDRFDVGMPVYADRPEYPVYIGMLGQVSSVEYMRDLKSDLALQKGIVPHQSVLEVLPVFFDKERLIAVPHLGYNQTNTEIPFLTHRWLSLSKFAKDARQKNDK